MGSPKRDGVRGPEDGGEDGIEKFEGEGDGEFSGPLDSSLADGLTSSSAVALARWRLCRRFRQWIAAQPINGNDSSTSR